jgi:DNA-binding transcriptional ArsR family regulator
MRHANLVVMVFDVLAEPKRRRILDLLRGQERSVSELVEALGMSQPAVSKHLKVLRGARLVDVRVDAQRRVYRLEPEPLRAVEDWLAPYRTMWESSLDALESHLDRMPAPKPADVPQVPVPGPGCPTREEPSK